MIRFALSFAVYIIHIVCIVLAFLIFLHLHPGLYTEM